MRSMGIYTENPRIKMKYRVEIYERLLLHRNSMNKIEVQKYRIEAYECLPLHKNLIKTLNYKIEVYEIILFHRNSMNKTEVQI